MSITLDKLTVQAKNINLLEGTAVEKYLQVQNKISQHNLDSEGLYSLEADITTFNELQSAKAKLESLAAQQGVTLKRWDNFEIGQLLLAIIKSAQPVNTMNKCMSALKVTTSPKAITAH